MMSRSAAIVLILLADAALGQGKEVAETLPDGSVMARYQVDDQGRKTGESEAFRENGTPRERATWMEDRLDGRHETFHENGKCRIRTCYMRGQEHGRRE
jgi:antitoxin component YwqK of YwqJK toxin-antitoxin module